MCSFWKLSVWVHLLCLLVVIAASEKTARENSKRSEDSSEQKIEADETSGPRDSSFVNIFSTNHLVKGFSYDLNRLNHRVDQLSLTIRQIIHVCPCARRISPPTCPNPWVRECQYSNYGHGQSGGYSGSESSGLLGNHQGTGQFGGHHGSSTSGHWSSSSGTGGHWGGSGSQSGGQGGQWVFVGSPGSHHGKGQGTGSYHGSHHGKGQGTGSYHGSHHSKGQGTGSYPSHGHVGKGWNPTIYN